MADLTPTELARHPGSDLLDPTDAATVTRRIRGEAVRAERQRIAGDSGPDPLLAEMADAYEQVRTERTRAGRDLAWAQFTAVAELAADAELKRRGRG